ncbi:aerobic ribonucleotide reductase large subunit [Klebsiella phage CPRSA]|nr:aerobic ribonucleotide reductase large subunit [Klebsiella phage CPRSA]
MNDIKVVVKSSGVRQPFDKEKIYKVLKWACDGHNIDVRAFLENVLELDPRWYDYQTNSTYRYQVLQQIIFLLKNRIGNT